VRIIRKRNKYRVFRNPKSEKEFKEFVLNTLNLKKMGSVIPKQNYLRNRKYQSILKRNMTINSINLYILTLPLIFCRVLLANTAKKNKYDVFDYYKFEL